MSEPQYTTRSMSQARRQRIIERHGYTCGMCPNTAGPFIIDHIVPLWISGDDSDENLWPLCADCNKPKTAKDMAVIAKSKRILGITRQGVRRKIPSRLFDKRFKKKLNGNVILAG